MLEVVGIENGGQTGDDEVLVGKVDSRDAQRFDESAGNRDEVPLGKRGGGTRLRRDQWRSAAECDVHSIANSAMELAFGPSQQTEFVGAGKLNQNLIWPKETRDPASIFVGTEYFILFRAVLQLSQGLKKGAKVVLNTSRAGAGTDIGVNGNFHWQYMLPHEGKEADALIPLLVTEGVSDRLI